MRNRVARKIILLIAIAVFLYSGVMMLMYYAEMRDGMELAESVAGKVVSVANEPDETGALDDGVMTETAAAPARPEETLQAEETEPVESIPAVTEKVCPIEVDFDALLQENKDVVAWIYCPGTPINYPVVQAEDNDYYIHRLLDGKTNSSGTLFMDYRNSADLSDWNSVIYGHNMKNGTMFGYLPHYKEQSYFEEHTEMFLLTPEQNYAIEVMAGFVTTSDDELYNAFCPDEAGKDALVNEWLNASDFVSNVYPELEDRIITLSTCSYEFDNARYVLVGVLRKTR